MKSKLQKIAASFILMIVINIGFSLPTFYELGIESPHVGLLFVLGLLLGPYGTVGAVLANILLDFLNGYSFIEIFSSAIFTFGVSYLAYKLWYTDFITEKITKPRLNNVYRLILFFTSILICGLVYSIVHANLVGIFMSTELDQFYFVSYFLNFINISFIFGILGIWLSKRFDFIETPKTSKKQAKKKLYRILFYSLVFVSIASSVLLFYNTDRNIAIAAVVLIGILLFGYLTKPFAHTIYPIEENTIVEKIIQNFLIITLIIASIGILISVLGYDSLTHLANLNNYVYLMPALIITDAIIVFFFIPGMIILKYIENKVLEPISSFSEIEGFIKENEKIESEGLVEIYSKYVNEKNEIGTLARSYTDLINHNNHYIENIREIEGEKERINAELNIAEKIQAASLPTEAIENDDFIVNGYSHPAKEVGGDFFDYYPLDDDNLAIIIGDVSGKGVPAALLAMITQVMAKQLIKTELDPSKVLYSLNNQLCENNSQVMFITSWLGIYNRRTGKLTFSNAGHNPPLLKQNGEFEYMDIDSGIVLGVMEDFEYIAEEITLANEIVLYTDGITDANNNNHEMYGEEKLLDFFNGFKLDESPIEPLLYDIKNFTDGAEQFDDMTLLYLKIKND